MTILEYAMRDPNVLADRDFIEAALSELETDIAYIEKRHNVVLVGDRADFNRARYDWLYLTKAQVAWAVSYWRSGIFRRYCEK